MVLSSCPLQTRARIIGLQVDPQYHLRLHELGVRPGAEFSVVSRAAFGGVVMNIAGTRVAMDRHSAKRMEVELLS